MENILELQQVSKKFPKSDFMLNDVTFSLPYGAILGFVGTLFAGIAICLSWRLHGCPFDQPIDILTLFALGVSMSLFMGAIFFPLFYLGGAERSDVFLIITILCAFGIDLVIVTVTDELLEPGITTILLGVAALLGCSLLAFFISYPLTVGIFRRKEY